MEKNGVLDPEKKDNIKKGLERFAQKAGEMGYNAITFDDLSHLVIHDFYGEDLADKIRSYQEFYTDLFAIARVNSLKIFITTDFMFFNDAIKKHTGGRFQNCIELFRDSVRKLLTGFPHINGIILRIGEVDGVDVEGDVISKLTIRTPRECRTLIRSVLPVFEELDRILVFRTWTLGAFPIGDLTWNPVTFNKVFGNIMSDNLIISHKIGETDFFRYLNLNPLFFEGEHQRIVELQTRREYEGFGEFPCYIGRDFEKYARYLRTCSCICGISVWCQTGGWSHFTNITFLRDSSIWNEINTYITINIFRNHITSEEAVIRYAEKHYPGKDPGLLLQLLKYSDYVIKQLWYIPEFSQKRLYFRRSCVPPLLWIFWDNILINHTLRKVIRRFVHERREAVADGYRALKKIKKMKTCAAELGIAAECIDFQYDTFSIIAESRVYLFGEWDPSIPGRITAMIEKYHRKYPNGFHFEYDFDPIKIKKWLIKTIFHYTLRRHPHYRIFDRFFFIPFSKLVYPLLRLWQKKRLPSFADEQAMGIQILFK